MGRKRPQKGGRRGARKSGTPRQDQRRDETAYNRAGGGAPGGGASEPSRLLLTKVARGAEIWDVYIATIPQNGGSNLTQLEFQESGIRHLRPRYSRPLAGALLDALYAGAPVSRARLEEELELAVREAEAGDGGSADAGSSSAELGDGPDADEADEAGSESASDPAGGG